MSSPRDDQWQEDYTRARSELIAGRFAEAARQFRALARTARDAFDQRLALDQAELAATWSDRNLRLTLATGDAEVSPALSNRRTTDEISILYTNAAVYGIASGITLAVITEPDSAAGGILPTLTLAGAALGAVALVDASPHELGYGVPQSIVSGMYIGFEEGLTWALWNQARSRYDAEWDDTAVSLVLWGSATAGAAAGAVVGTLGGTTPGRAAFVGSTALWGGSVAGLGVAALSSDDRDQRDDRAMLASAIGVSAGAVAGMLVAGPVSPSIARVRFLDLGAVGGGLVFGGLYVAGADEDADGAALMGISALGIGAGLAVSWFATAGMAGDRGPARSRETSLTQSLRPTFSPIEGGALFAVQGAL